MPRDFSKGTAGRLYLSLVLIKGYKFVSADLKTIKSQIQHKINKFYNLQKLAKIKMISSRLVEQLQGPRVAIGLSRLDFRSNYSTLKMFIV